MADRLAKIYVVQIAPLVYQPYTPASSKECVLATNDLERCHLLLSPVKFVRFGDNGAWPCAGRAQRERAAQRHHESHAVVVARACPSHPASARRVGRIRASTYRRYGIQISIDEHVPLELSAAPEFLVHRLIRREPRSVPGGYLGRRHAHRLDEFSMLGAEAFGIAASNSVRNRIHSCGMS